MTTPREKWKSAKRKVEEIETLRAKLVAHTDTDYRQAQDRLEEIEEDYGSVVARCDGCYEPIFDGEPYHSDAEGDAYTCSECSPTYKDILDSPESFLDAEGELMTPASAKEFVDRHIATGGFISDSLAH